MKELKKFKHIIYQVSGGCCLQDQWVSGFNLFIAFGVDQLRDGSYDTYWQSDGPQPHLVNIQFRKKTTVQDVCVYTDYKADESYTPNRLENTFIGM